LQFAHLFVMLYKPGDSEETFLWSSNLVICLSHLLYARILQKQVRKEHIKSKKVGAWWEDWESRTVNKRSQALIRSTAIVRKQNFTYCRDKIYLFLPWWKAKCMMTSLSFSNVNFTNKIIVEIKVSNKQHQIN